MDTVDLLILLFSLMWARAEIGSFLDEPWVWSMGCYKIPRSTINHNFTNNSPGRCFLACGEETTIIAIQEKACQCRPETSVSLPAAPNASRSFSPAFQCGWAVYKKANRNELTEREINTSSPGCVSISGRIRQNTYTVDTCTQPYDYLCYSVIMGNCQPRRGNDAITTCLPDSPIRSFTLVEKRCRSQALSTITSYWIGLRMLDINRCDSSPCQNDGYCENGFNSYTCQCLPGYTGQDCQTDIDDCESDPCENGGTCADEINNFTCTCLQGYTGHNCSIDIDECGPKPCVNGGACKDGINNYTCLCPSGYTGFNCSIDIDDCKPKPCLNGGTCKDGINNYTCSCPPGYTGFDCSKDIDDCEPKPCLNGGTCKDGINNYTCLCHPGYTGFNCSTSKKITYCFPGACANDGLCINGVNNYTCKCLPGFDGWNCSVFTNTSGLTHTTLSFNGSSTIRGPKASLSTPSPAVAEQQKGDFLEQNLTFIVIAGSVGLVVFIIVVVVIFVVCRFTKTTSALHSTIKVQNDIMQEQRSNIDRLSLGSTHTYGLNNFTRPQLSGVDMELNKFDRSAETSGYNSFQNGTYAEDVLF